MGALGLISKPRIFRYLRQNNHTIQRLKYRFAFLGMLAILAACQTTSGTFCQIANPVRLSPETVATLTDAEVAAVLQHNEKGKRLCGWKAN